MSNIPQMAMAAPPLPPGWTQHLGPGGQVYYYNTQTQESTYVRPLPSFTAPAAPTQKKEKAQLKTPIPGTDWLRVITTSGSVFYSNKVTKQGSWTIPLEIEEAVKAFDGKAKADAEDAVSAQAEQKRARKKEESAKRKRDEVQAIDEVSIPKKVKLDEDGEGEDESEGDSDESEEEEEEEWQKEAAEQLAREAEEEAKRKKEEEERLKKEKEEEERKAKLRQINMPAKVEMSLEEGKALFKTLLREKDINPLLPWDICLPQFINDPRYVLLPSVAARKEAFDEYCRERARELRETAVKKEKSGANPKEDFDRLLKEEVKSTRASWSEFRRTWKKDRRFYGWGRDDREREKAFRDYLKALGEKKKAAAQKAEADFFALLKEQTGIKAEDSWKEVKKLSSIYKDPRYDAVGSSSLREELFNTYIKTLATAKVQAPAEEMVEDDDAMVVEKESKESRRERALKEREQKVKAEQGRVSMNIEKSRQGMNQEEGERVFKTMLVDAIRDPQTTWDTAVEQLKKDPRFTNSPLNFNHQVKLFHTHITHLRSRHLSALHALFAESTSTLASRFTELPIETLIVSPHVQKLGYDIDQLEDEFRRWQKERYTEARRAFDEMLHENPFVEFWGRLSKMQDVTLDQGLQVASEDIGEDDEPASKLNMKALAQTVDIGEMVKVLKARTSIGISMDKRYTDFDYTPEEREQWLRVTHPRTWSHRERAKMRILSPFFVSLALVSSFAQAEKLDYQSDVARLRNIVINSLYTHKEIFLRELISNANDALEKLRITSLKDKTLWDGTPLNVTIKAIPGEDGKGGKIIITDSGIGMTPEELATNLGTLAKSGTSDFVKQVEDGGANGNLIGAFGVGFYSSFLVADRVEVASISPKVKDGKPVQHIFASAADESSFEVFADPRGNTLGGRGTEITLHLKPDAVEYLDTQKLAEIIHKHSAFSSSFPVYLWEKKTKEVEDEEAIAAAAAASASESAAKAAKTEAKDDDEAVIEDEKEEEPKAPSPPAMKKIEYEDWTHINAQPPLWTRDPKNITDLEYQMFYTGFFKDFGRPLAWTHFSGDSPDGVPFKAIIYLPEKLPDAYWEKPMEWQQNDVKLMVKRTFITSDLGEHSLPKWANWIKVVVDAEDLPLNVSRETLQSKRFIKQMRAIILKRLIQLFNKLETDNDYRWKKLQDTYGSVLKMAAVEDTKNRDKLSALCRFTSNQRNGTSFDSYVSNMRKGQSQIFYLAEMGQMADELAQSIFAEKIIARGYELLLLTEPLDEILFGTLREWKSLPFQDAAKAGLKFGDEGTASLIHFQSKYMLMVPLDPEAEAAREKELNEQFKPLVDWMKVEATDIVKDVKLSNRLVTSPCAIVADNYGYTANVQRMMTNSNHKRGDILHEFAMKAKTLEINPHSPLIEGLLRRIKDLPTDEDEKDEEAEAELKEVTSILIDGALVRSGFDVQSKNHFFNRVDRVLRRSLGVSEKAQADVTVEPAPPVSPPEAPKPKVETEEEKPRVIIPDHLKDKVAIELEEYTDDEELPPRDEL
ncbi:Hsp90 protein-domain-containing protein [Coprinopsis sp. MPI-PUGE-AT-0042]|nr:Hsp90 protein-domain-containing protein [Coprinopsis sp. MPI-PUGE-AT-0042]